MLLILLWRISSATKSKTSITPVVNSDLGFLLLLILPQELNRNLDSLTEHYDIPKVSWTK